jgi:hypothetical protein
VGSRYAMPDRVIPERGQGPENGIQPSTKQRSDVLQENEAGSKFANETGDLKEQSAPLAGQPQTLPCDADVLAREAAANPINGNSIGSKSLCGKLAHVLVARDIWPVLGEDFARELFDFAEGDGFETARSFKAKGKSSNAGKQV